MKALEYYSVPTGLTGSNHSIDHLYYIKRDVAENMPDDNIDLLTWYGAYHVCMALKDIEGAKAAMQKIQEIQNAETI